MRSRPGQFRPARSGQVHGIDGPLASRLSRGCRTGRRPRGDVGRSGQADDHRRRRRAGRRRPLAPGSSRLNAASSAASAIAASNAYTAYGQTSTVTINIPPVAPSAFAGQSDCVQAVVQFNQPALFSAIWGTRSLPVTVRGRGPSGSDTLLERRHSLAGSFGHRDDALGLDAGSRR